MIALLTALLFAAAALTALGVIAVTILPQRQRIAQLLCEGLGIEQPANARSGKVIAVEFNRPAATVALRAAA